MSSHSGVEQTVALLDSLRATVREFSTREEKLNRELTLESGRFHARLKQAEEAQEAESSAELSAAEQSFQAARQRLEANYEKRKARIALAFKNSKRHRLEQVEAEESRRKFEIQRDLLQTDRGRDAELKNTDTAFQTFRSELVSQREKLAQLEARTRNTFAGYGKFLRLLTASPDVPESNPAQSHEQMLNSLRELLGEIAGQIHQFRRHPLPLFFRFFPLWLWVGLLLLAPLPLVYLLQRAGNHAFTYENAAIAAGAGIVVMFVIYFAGRQLSSPAAGKLAAAIGRARRLLDACEQKSSAWHQQESERIKSEADSRTRALEQQWRETINTAAGQRTACALRANERTQRATARHEQLHREKTARLARGHTEGVAQLKRDILMRKRAMEEEHSRQKGEFEANQRARWEALKKEWTARVEPLYEALHATQPTVERLFPEWKPEMWPRWTAPERFPHKVKFAELQVNVEPLAGVTLKHERLPLPRPGQLQVPLLLTFPQQGSLLFETKHAGRDEVVAALNNIILRLLSVSPPGRVNFTIIDPLELGQNFAGLMHLTDYEDRLINGRIWTQAGQIEEQLANLNEHIEKVTQMYLRNEYATIAEYNEQAGRIAEKYHFLVIADFPVNFSDVAAKRLLSIAASGPRCGVYTLIHWDQRKPAPLEFVPEELRKSSVCIHWSGSGFTLAGQPLDGTTLHLDTPPGVDLATDLLHQIGKASVDSNRIEMPFDEIAPPESEIWSLDTTNEMRVPIGRTGATKLQYLAIGKGTRQHALIAGKTGSGKSTLFHVMITNLALWCSPEQVEFYLVDFKKGVEFKCYAANRLPHARVVAIESDREFGLSVLQRVDEELKRRGDMFRKLGAQDIAGYKKAGGTEAIPRTLLLIDEFQEFFTEDDRIAQSAALLLDRIVRQGRAFGIHVMLGSQTLGGAYTLARATLGQMVVRIALQCNEADAYLIMDENNAAPRLLSRPGEAIYNDTAGTIEGNSPFQVVWLTDDEREQHLAKVRQLAERTSAMAPVPIVFEGNAPADVRENVLLRRLLEAETLKSTRAGRVWLGAPNSIKGPTEAVFHRQSGNHLLIVGQRDEAALAMLGVSLISLAAQHGDEAARFIVLDCSPAETAHRQFLEKVIHAMPHEVEFVGHVELDSSMAALESELEKRADPEHAATAPSVYLFIHGLPRFKKLRQEEDFGISLDAPAGGTPPGTVFTKIVTDGASLGMHVICTCDTLNNVNRFLSRKALSEFEMRVLFQMSANDSATLIDSPKANNLGLHRAIFYNEQEGYLETFRPYALPDNGWIEEAERQLSRLFAAMRKSPSEV